VRPIASVGIAFNAAAFTAAGDPWPFTPVELLAAAGAGVGARGMPAMRPAAHAWIATNIGLLLLWVALVVNNLLR